MQLRLSFFLEAYIVYEIILTNERYNTF